MDLTMSVVSTRIVLSAKVDRKQKMERKQNDRNLQDW